MATQEAEKGQIKIPELLTKKLGNQLPFSSFLSSAQGAFFAPSISLLLRLQKWELYLIYVRVGFGGQTHLWTEDQIPFLKMAI